MTKARRTVSNPLPAETPEIVVNVLGYREDDMWVALGLEIDIRGYGETFEKALEELRDLTSMQISFAQFKGQPEMIWRPADPVWFERFAEIRTQRLRNLTKEPGDRADYQIRGLPIPPPHIIAAMKSRFQPTNG